MNTAHDYARAAAATLAYPDGNHLTALRLGYAPARPRIPLNLEPVDNRPWVTDAACRGMDTNLFFPTAGEPADQAKAVCATCPVAEECGDWALANGERFGVWGGQSEKARRQARRVRRKVRCGTTGGYDRHKRNHEPVCDACRAAYNEYHRLYQTQRREGAA